MEAASEGEGLNPAGPPAGEAAGGQGLDQRAVVFAVAALNDAARQLRD